MIKGHTKIELFNAETGKIEKTYEKDNLVTNAVQYLIAAQNMMGKVMNQSVFPIATLTCLSPLKPNRKSPWPVFT